MTNLKDNVRKPKILLWDIESGHNLVLTFGLYKQDIPPENIKVDRHIYCISYKWFGEKKVHTISILDDPKRFKKNNHDDYYVVKKFREVIEEADAHVAHYGDNFDMKMLNTRLIINKLRPLPKITSFDTKKIASRHFKFNCNKLDYIAKQLGHTGKLQNPKGLWIDCFDGDINALKHMAKYNRVDVEVLEHVFERLLPFMNSSPLNMEMFIKGARCTNPACGSTNLQWRGWAYTKTNKYRRFVCKDCGKWSNERKALKMESVNLK